MTGFYDNERFRKLLSAYPAKAIEFLYEAYYQSLINLSQSLTHNQSAAEDIVQETFIHIWERHQWLSQHHDRSIQHYLVRVVKNMSITYYKKNQKTLPLKPAHLNSSFVAIENSIEVKWIAFENKQQLRILIDRFPRRERQCLLLKMDQEMTLDQIAAHLGVSRKAVERSLTSANKRLRKHLKK
jgi:RNA polymerase sigma factor (sigma-70 family)